MNASAQQIRIRPSPSATSGDPVEPRSGTTGFKNFLDMAMKDKSRPKEPELPEAPASRAVKKTEPHRNTPHIAANTQTPAVMPVAADPASNLPAAATQDRTPGIDNVSAKGSRRSARGVQRLEALAGRQFQPDTAGIPHEAGNVQELPGQLFVPHATNQKNSSQGNLQGGAKSSRENSSSLSSQDPEQRLASAKAQPLPLPSGQPVRTPIKLLNVLAPIMKGPSGYAEATASILQTGNESVPMPAPIEAQPPGESVPEANTPGTQNEPLQKAMTAMENLQLNFFSRATSQNVAPLPSGLQSVPTLGTHGIGGHTTANSAVVLQQKHQAAALQGSGKDSGGSKGITGQEAGKGLPLNAAASGTSGDSPKDGKNGQNSSSRHSEVSESQGSGTGTAPGSFNSVAASTTASSATALSVAPSQPAPVNSMQPNAGALPQPGATHAPVANKLMASAENPLNPVGGVINRASMLQTQGKTEMRVAMQTESLGPLELHAVLDGGRLGASIAVVNHDAHTLLTNNLPSLQQVLNEQNLRVDHLSVLNASTSSGTNTGNGGGFQFGGHAQSRPNAPRWAFSRPAQLVPESKAGTVVEVLRGRLSVRA